MRFYTSLTCLLAISFFIVVGPREACADLAAEYEARLDMMTGPKEFEALAQELLDAMEDASTEKASSLSKLYYRAMGQSKLAHGIVAAIEMSEKLRTERIMPADSLIDGFRAAITYFGSAADSEQVEVVRKKEELIDELRTKMVSIFDLEPISEVPDEATCLERNGEWVQLIRVLDAGDEVYDAFWFCNASRGKNAAFEAAIDEFQRAMRNESPVEADSSD